MKASIILQKTTQSLSTTLTLVSQRLPFIQHFAPLLTSPASLRITTPLLTSFAGTHTLTGQTTQILAVEGSENKLNVEVGEQFTWKFDSARHAAKSSEVTGLPPGATYTFGYDTDFNGQQVNLKRGGTIDGAITIPGTYQVTIVGYRFANLSGFDKTPSYPLTINVTQAVTPFETWQGQFWMGDDLANEAISGPNADPDGDGIPNLLEFTLELNPTTPQALPGTFGDDPNDPELLLWELPYIGTGNLTFQENSDLTTDNWTDVAEGDIELLPNTIQFRASKLDATKKFFRLKATL